MTLRRGGQAEENESKRSTGEERRNKINEEVKGRLEESHKEFTEEEPRTC